MFSLPFTNPIFVPTQVMENMLTRLLSARHAKGKTLLLSEKELAHAILSSAKKARLAKTANAFLFQGIVIQAFLVLKDSSAQEVHASDHINKLTNVMTT